MVERFKILFLWSFILFVAINATAFVSVILFGQGLGVVVAIVLALIYSYLCAKKAAWAFYNLMKDKKITYAAYGAFVVMFAAAMSSILDYFLTGEFRLSSGGILGLAIGALGGYSVDRKIKGTKLFGR